MTLGVLYSRVRVEEKQIFACLERRHIAFVRLDEALLHLALGGRGPQADIVLDRSIQHGRSLYTLTLLNAAGITTVNSAEVVQTCGDKVLTSAKLSTAGLPMPKTSVAFTQKAALDAIEEMGYPVVLKPLVGSWGRLLAKINDRDAAEAVLEHKQTLGSYQHGIFFIQEYVAKPQRDIRTLVVDNEVIGAIYRASDHWITNTARTGRALACTVTPEIERLSLEAARAVGGGALAVDLLEHADGLLLNEVNSTMEFHGFAEATGIDVADRLVNYLVRLAQRSRAVA